VVVQWGSFAFWETVGRIWETVSVRQNVLKTLWAGNEFVVYQHLSPPPWGIEGLLSGRPLKTFYKFTDLQKNENVVCEHPSCRFSIFTELLSEKRSRPERVGLPIFCKRQVPYKLQNLPAPPVCFTITFFHGFGLTSDATSIDANWLATLIERHLRFALQVYSRAGGFLREGRVC